MPFQVGSDCSGVGGPSVYVGGNAIAMDKTCKNNYWRCSDKSYDVRHFFPDHKEIYRTHFIPPLLDAPMVTTVCLQNRV